MVHLGLGNFFRAHQAWYTEHAPDAAEWGIAAFTGRSPQLAETLGAQQGLYTLLTRAAAGDRPEVISSLSAVYSGTDHEAWLECWADPGLAVVTLTVTEAGYLRAGDGGLDLTNEDVRGDIEALRADPRSRVSTVPGRLVAGLLARRAAGGGALTLLPCDNLPDNGPALQRVVLELAQQVDPTLVAWSEQHLAVGTTMVDRITPATTEQDLADVLSSTGCVDLAPVATEPFSEWVIAGQFPAGRPGWEHAGATIVADVAPFEQRKLWLLNGAHSLLAYTGPILGHTTVAEAIADPRARGWVESWWDEAVRHLELDATHLVRYREALLERFGNPRIRHLLAQIAADGSQKIPVRIVPTLRAELAQGRVPAGATTAIAGWVQHLRGLGAPVREARPERVAGLGEGTLAESVAAVLGFLGSDLADSPELVRAVEARAAELAELAR